MPRFYHGTPGVDHYFPALFFQARPPLFGQDEKIVQRAGRRARHDFGEGRVASGAPQLRSPSRHAEELERDQRGTRRAYTDPDEGAHLLVGSAWDNDKRCAARKEGVTGGVKYATFGKVFPRGRPCTLSRCE